MAAGTVHIPWYATFFRGDKFETGLTEISAVSQRYGASDYRVYRSRDDMYKFLQIVTFDSKDQFEAYWNGPEFLHFRGTFSGYYQVPVLYVWHDMVIQGGMEEALTGAPSNGETV